MYVGFALSAYTLIRAASAARVRASMELILIKDGCMRTPIAMRLFKKRGGCK